MSLKEMSKEQKQYLVLGLLGAVILAVLATLGVKSSLSSITAAKDELAELTDKIEKADRLLARREKTSKDYDRTVDNLKGLLENAPPERNYYSWATEVVYTRARMVGLEVDSIDEINISRVRSPEKAGDEVKLEAYSLRVAAHGGYENTKRFLERIKQDYPLVRFTGIEISTGSNPESHDVQLFMQWPFNLGAMDRISEAVETRQSAVAESDSNPVALRGPDQATEPHPPVTKPEPVAAVPEYTPSFGDADEPERAADHDEIPVPGEPVPDESSDPVSVSEVEDSMDTDTNRMRETPMEEESVATNSLDSILDGLQEETNEKH